MFRTLEPGAGLIDQELVARFEAAGWGDTDSGIRSRRDELVRMELLENTGETRPTRKGRDSIVWARVLGLDEETIELRLSLPPPPKAPRAGAAAGEELEDGAA